MFFQCFLYIRSINLCAKSLFRIEFRIEVDRIQFIQVYRMIHRLVAISCHKYGISFFSCS